MKAPRIWSAIALLSLLSTPLAAQDVVVQADTSRVALPEWMQRELADDPNAFEFQRVWHSALLRAIVQRDRLESQGQETDSLSPQRAAELGTAVRGVLQVPVFPILYANTDSLPYSAEHLDRRLFTAGGDTLTLTRFYREVSRGLFRIEGVVHDWIRVDSVDTFYEGTDSGEPPYLGYLLKDVLDRADELVNFRIYDRNGDGFVDVVAFVQPQSGGECINGNVWSLRWDYGSAIGKKGEVYRTRDGVSILDFVIQPALECDGAPVEIGIFAHEFGHAVGLPDLYSTSDPATNAGIDWWGLMGSGNQNQPSSPAHLEAWSKVELGWVPVLRIERDTSDLVIRAVGDSGSIVRIDIPGSDGEYFLLENRQRLGSDIHLPSPGLLIWHVDSLEIARRAFHNIIQNNPRRKGVDLEEADAGLLDEPRGGADHGDPFPGSTNAREFGPNTRPNSDANDGFPSGIRVGNIRQVGSEIVVDISLHASPDAPPRPEAPPAEGPVGRVRFARPLDLKDVRWLQSLGLSLLEISTDTSSVLVRFPPGFPTELQRYNQRVQRVTMQPGTP
jgi:M6 family metalloprotease-like protein